MIEDWIARILCLVASIIIVVLSEQRLNLMSPSTRPGFRLAFLALTVGGVWQILDLLTGDVPSWSVVAVRIGLASTSTCGVSHFSRSVAAKLSAQPLSNNPASAGSDPPRHGIPFG